jgi:hypothetical protein
MMKKIYGFCTALICILSIQNASAAASGFGGDPMNGDLYWYCEALGVIVPTPPLPARASFCFGYSPDETLRQLEFQINIKGENNIPPACNDPFNYDQTSPVVGFDRLGTTSDEIVVAEYIHLLNLSWRLDSLQGFGDWALLTWMPPLLGSGSASTPTYGNVVGGTAGNCY